MNKYFRYPVEYVGISQRWKDGQHYGIDFGWNSNYMPMKIFAAADGVVTVAPSTPNAAIGWYVVIYHGVKDGKDIYTQYKHLESKPMVKVGDKVTMQTQIGVMGATGYECYGRHLHFDYIPVPQGKAFTQTYRVNPAPYLYAYNDMVVGVKGQDGVQIQKVNMTVAQGEKVLVEEPKPITTNTYIIVKGDSMSKIAVKFNMTLAELIALNPQIKNLNKIYVGDKIYVKAVKQNTTTKAIYYTVQKGDTLGKIARNYGVTIDTLLSLNPQIKNANLIYPKDKIRVI